MIVNPLRSLQVRSITRSIHEAPFQRAAPEGSADGYIIHKDPERMTVVRRESVPAGEFVTAVVVKGDFEATPPVVGSISFGTNYQGPIVDGGPLLIDGCPDQSMKQIGLRELAAAARIMKRVRRS